MVLQSRKFVVQLSKKLVFRWMIDVIMTYKLQLLVEIQQHSRKEAKEGMAEILESGRILGDPPSKGNNHKVWIKNLGPCT